MRKTTQQYLAFLLLVVALLRTSVASAEGIAVTLVDFQLSTTQNVNLGYTLTISAQVTNTDTVAFNGFLDFGLHNSNNNLTAESIFNKPPYSARTISLAPGETVPAIFSVDIQQPFFTPGPDVVVVWPISSQSISDSILINLLIEDPSGVEENKNAGFTYLVMNDRILLRYATSEMNFQQVRMFNILGQQAASLHSNFITEIPVPNLPKGIYICEMLTADNKTRVIKFIH